MALAGRSQSAVVNPAPAVSSATTPADLKNDLLDWLILFLQLMERYYHIFLTTVSFIYRGGVVEFRAGRRRWL